MLDKTNILLIEDNPVDQDLTEEYLSETNFGTDHLTVADTLHAGLKELSKGRTDILLLDLSLPDSFGLEGLNKVRKIHPHLPVVILTGLQDNIFALNAIRNGAQDYLVKGKYDSYALEKAIDYANERKKTESILIRQASELEQFAYLCSHNLRSPVLNLHSLLQLIEMSGENVEKNELFGKLKKVVTHMLSTIDSLSHVIALKHSPNLEREKVDLQNAFEDVLDSIETQVREGKAEIMTDFSQCPEVNFPLVHVQSIFQNLVSNAIKYRRQEVKPVIQVTSARVNKSIRISVSDNGRGMNLELYGHKLFKLFQRFHLDINDGQGIGLYMIKIIIEDYGGNIEVKSKVGKGTTFNVYLR